MNRTDIEAQIASYLNRSDLASSIAFWFNISHIDAQRLKNWKFQESTTYEILVNGVEQYCAPTDIKEPYDLYAFDPSTNKVIGFYHQVDISTVRHYRHHRDEDWCVQIIEADPLKRGRHHLGLFAIWAEEIELYPKPGTGLDGKQLRLDYYRYSPVPEAGCGDWLTLIGFDYLVYRSLVEAIPFLDATDQRIVIWGKQAEKAQANLVGVDVSATWASSSLQMRG